MIWNILLGAMLLAAIVLVPSAIIEHSKRKKARGHYTSFETKQVMAVIIFICAAAMLVTSLVSLGMNSKDVSVYNRSGDLVAMKVQQRDDLATIVKEELSTDQYAAIMAATPNTDVLIILGNNAATFLVEKAKLLVSLNAEVNTMVNGLEQDRIQLCAFADNPMTPRLFVSPDCPDPIVVKAP